MVVEGGAGVGVAGVVVVVVVVVRADVVVVVHGIVVTAVDVVVAPFAHDAVVAAVDVPVTLKIRTGTAPDERNGVAIAQIAEQAGVSALAVHGRTRACAFKGEVEYDTIAAIVAATQFPVFANGDIDSPQKARRVQEHTGAAGIMIGRGAQGRHDHPGVGRRG